MRKIKNFKNANMRRKGYVDLTNEIVLPIYSRGSVTLQDTIAEFEKTLKIPKAQLRPATGLEIEELRQMGYEFKTMPVMIRELDKSSDQWFFMLKERNQMTVFIRIAIHVDLEYPISKTLQLWEALGLANATDFLGMAKFIRDLDLREPDLEAIQSLILFISKSNFKEYKDFEDELNKATEALSNVAVN